MLRFEEHIENQTKPEADFIRGYKGIVPEVSRTDDEISKFWNDEFASGDDFNEFDDYDTLLSEVFNVDADKIDIEFAVDDELKELLDVFKPDNWSEISPKEKMSHVEHLTKKLSNCLELKQCPNICWLKDMKDNLGEYLCENNTINLNADYLDDSKETVDTVAHELRHAYQHMRAEICETLVDVLYKCNFVSYIAPESLPGGGCLHFFDYYNQYVEVDAREFANKITEAMT